MINYLFKFRLLKLPILLVGTISCLNARADVAGDLGNFFTKLGYDGNITEPVAYQGQAAGYYSGGSMVLRNQVKNIQLINLDLPSLKAGCGGIDLFGGGFSFINAQAITEFFQKIMSNATGYIFKLALQTAVPQIEQVMESVQKMAQEINASNFNSCEMAETLVSGLWPKMEATQKHICKDLGNHKNIFSDWADARQGCSKGKYNEVMDKAAEDPAYEKTVIVNKNLIWAALVKNDYPKDLREFFMSLSGTIVYGEEGKVNIFSPLAKDRNVLKALLAGGNAEIYRCDEIGKCLKPKKGIINISVEKALYAKIHKTINELVSALRTDTGSLNSELKKFLEMVKFPLLKFISVHLMNGNVAMAMSIANYSEVIAKSLLLQYMHEALQVVENSLSGTDYAPEIHKQLTDQIHQALVFVEKIKAESSNDLQDLMTFIDSSKVAEQEITSRVIGQNKAYLGVSK